MKKILTIVATVVLTLGVSAQQGGHSNYVGLNFGGGLNTMTFNPEHGKSSLGLGFDGGLHYAHFFNKHFGIGIGIHYTYANAYAKYNFSEVSTSLVHANNTSIHYDLTTTFDNWRERQTVGVLGIPVELFYRTALCTRWDFIGGLGVQFELPIHGNYSASEGEYSTTGSFAALGSYAVSDMPEHGFSTYDGTFSSKIDNLAMGLSVVADAGVRLALNDNWGLYLGIYGSYGVTDMLGTKNSEPMVLLNTTDPSKLDYNGTYGSNEINSLHLLRVGIKVGVDFGWPTPKNDEETAPAVVPFDNSAAERAEADRLAAEKAAAEKAAREKAEAERLAAERLAAEMRAAEEAANAAKPQQEEPITLDSLQVLLDKSLITFSINGVNPRFNAETDTTLHRLSAIMQKDSNVKVVITGHTDSKGSAKSNRRLGVQRALAVKSYMVKLGAPANNIKCVSKGEKAPVATNANAQGRAKNRRATVKLK